MSKADEIFYRKTFEKIERYAENKLIELRLETQFVFRENTKIAFCNVSQTIDIQGTIDLEILEAINLTVKELGWNV